VNRPDPTDASQVNWTQYEPGQAKGHYESFYLRGNDPGRPLAFWLRYTIFAPAGRPADALGELWAIVFDGETGRHTSAKVEVPFASCVFSRTSFDVRVAGATLDGSGLRGRAGEIGWDLTYEGTEPPLYLLQPRLYKSGFPPAKSLVSMPLARFTGRLTVGDREITVAGWPGSQNHNWGSRHTDRYAFGQVAGFDNAPESFLEVATARNRIGPLWMPAATPLVLRHRGRQLALTSLGTAIRARADGPGFRASGAGAIGPAATSWTFASGAGPVRVTGRIEAPADAFVLLEYPNPPGGVKFCLNTKLAACEIEVTDRATGERDVLRSAHGALYEVLDDVDPRTR
jgi:hypothetical protein